MSVTNKPYFSQTLGELNELIGWIVIKAPHSPDTTVLFLDQNIGTELPALHEG